MQHGMVKIQLQTKLKRGINIYNNKNKPYNIKGLRLNPTKMKKDIENA